MSSFSKKVEDLIASGWTIENSYGLTNWQKRVQAFLGLALGPDAVARFRAHSVESSMWESVQSQIGVLEGLLLVEERKLEAAAADSSAERRGINVPPKYSKRVFLVHGQDEEAKQSTARFLERIGLETIILHEQASSGRTIIEKFEAFSDVGFAVVLLTPDDVGGRANEPGALKPRARQNVILELGYFIGRLTRRRVCALFRQGVEIPSDYQGVVYVEFDQAGGWRTKLAQELVEAGFSINLEALLK